jgi:alpha-beta hydrolase superfamily lysophospholipase
MPGRGQERPVSSSDKATGSSGEVADERAVGRRAVWLPLEPNPVLAFLYQAHGTAAGAPPQASTAVLLCPTFGWEEMCSYRGLRVWSQMLARAGYPAATFDLPGTGDSGGSARDPGLLDACTNAVSDASAWLSRVTSAERVCAIGIGFGGLLAYRAVARGAAIDDLILWGVPARGRVWLREQRAYAQMVQSRRPEDHREETDHEYIGFVLTADATQEIEALRLTDLELPDAAGARVLLLGRDGRPPDAALREHLEHAGASVDIQDTDDYAALMLHPQEARAPAATIANTTAWLRDTRSSARASKPPRPAWRSRAAGLLERSTTELDSPSGPIRETPLSLQGPSGSMFAVLSEAIDTDPAPLCAVWLNGGALRHTGPNRAWVEAARRWAARGVPTVRVDLAGIGDSEGEEGCVSNADLYDPVRTRETLAVLDQLSERGLPGRYVLGGLCSGAYWSLHAALADARVAGALLINLYAFFWSESLVAERDTSESLSALRGYGWRQLMARDLTLRQVRKAASSLRPTRLQAGAGHPVEQAQSEQIENALDRLRDQGTQVLLLFSTRERLREQLERQGVPDELDRWPNLAIETIPSTDHMFRALWLQRHVHASLDRALERMLECS